MPSRPRSSCVVFALALCPSGIGCGAASGNTPTTTELPRSTPESQGVRSEGVLALVDALESEIDHVHSLMLVRHGNVVAEGWWAPYAAEDPHVLYSVTKSFNGTAVGFAAQESLLSLDDRVLDHFADLAPAQPAPQMQDLTIRHLLTMSTGHRQDPMDTLRAREDGQWIRAFLETELQVPPGALFVYNSAASYMLAAIVQRVTGETVQEYLQPRLFEPLGIEDAIWGQSPEGINLGAGGLYVRTEDLAKFGQFYLQHGEWNGEQLLSAEWADAATSMQIRSGVNPDDNWGNGYGFQFWRNKVGGFRADGSLGQFSIVLPEQDTVLAITSGTNDLDGVMNLVWEHLLPALEPEPLEGDAAAQAALEGRLAALTLAVQAGAASSPRAAEVSGLYRLGGNLEQLDTLTLDLTSAEGPSLTIVEAGIPHLIPFGLGSWERTRTGYNRGINELFDVPEQTVAASGAWIDDDTLAIEVCFAQTPYALTFTFRFDADRVSINRQYDIRWGSTTLPLLTGTKAP